MNVGLVDFASITKIFGGTVTSDVERQNLFKEALLLTLARATSSDVNIRPVEVETVRKIVQSATGEEVSAADVRVAAASELYEKAALDDYLHAIGRKLGSRERAILIRSLAEVVKSDRRISPKEVDFFNWAVSALRATPAEIAGLVEDA
jgi:uncharacterized tellurite resistance protein B-like protein